MRTKAELIKALEDYPDDALIAIQGEYSPVPIERIKFYDTGENSDDSPAVIFLYEDNYAGEYWMNNV